MKKQKNDLKSKDVLARYLHDIDQIPMLSSKEENKLADKIKRGNHNALSRLVNANLKFVVFIARDYQDRGLPLDELICEGNIGLMEAAKRYDNKRGVKFISYAVWWIRQSILRALANHSRLVRLPINHVWALQKMVTTVENLEQNLGRTPELEEVADELKISPEKLSKNMTFWGRELSLEDSTRPDYESLSLMDRISSDEFAAPSGNLLDESLKIDVKLALQTLSACEEKVIRLYYGIEEDRPLTLLEIGSIMDLSRERIRQIKNKALRKLRYLNRREKLQQYLCQ
ncbi:RNA polymerase sigma factor RpoD/SigA [candidate division KSB1 bacterium]|nr:RNA polymerase sigma factor RpoD/SigA [candidate division KSB1 bacterium]MBL7094574.1 RNA polymerase sigma factor RpoD/SigA [candidate division KSB1 bacterium]